MLRALLISVRFHDGRYHGAGAWPPAPARLFQALLAGAANGHRLAEEDRAALAWLERQGAPVIAAPAARKGQGFTTFVPNNDLDAVDGDPARIGEIRAGKTVRPYLFDAETPLLYGWTWPAGEAAEGPARVLCALAERLYQLGRGIDMAWAWGEVVSEDVVARRLEDYRGVVHRPSMSGDGSALDCPQVGSLASLEARFQATWRRFSKAAKQQFFTQPPKPRFRRIVYDSPPRRFLFDLRAETEGTGFAPWPLARVAALATALRDRAAHRLALALPDRDGTIRRLLIGREATAADKALRVRILPLPSIGHRHTHPAIRRVLVEVPPDGGALLPADDIAWAFSGLAADVDGETGEIRSVLVPSADTRMLTHYGAGERSSGARIWQTMTPAVLAVGRRPGRLSGRQRLENEAAAVAAVVAALRHAGIEAKPEEIQVQREPFHPQAARAEAFGPGSRFEAARLWHVRVVFARPAAGPIVLGDGRYAGLGLMVPQEDAMVEASPGRHA